MRSLLSEIFGSVLITVKFLIQHKKYLFICQVFFLKKMWESEMRNEIRMLLDSDATTK